MNMFQVMNMVNQFRNNPQALLQRFGIPSQYNNPDSVAKYLLGNGRVTQSQIDQARQFFNSNAQR